MSYFDGQLMLNIQLPTSLIVFLKASSPTHILFTCNEPIMVKL